MRVVEGHGRDTRCYLFGVAHAQCEVAWAEQVLASCHAHKYETIAELYRFKAWHKATNLDKKEMDVGIM